MKKFLAKLTGIPLYWHILIILIAVLNFATLSLLKSNLQSSQVVEQLMVKLQALSSDLLVKNGSLVTSELQTDETSQEVAVYVLTSPSNKALSYINFKKDDLEIRIAKQTVIVDYPEEITSLELKEAIISELMQMKQVTIIAALIQGILFNMLVFLVLAIVLMFLGKFHWKFREVLKRISAPYGIGSILTILCAWFYQGASVAYLLGIFITGVLVAMSVYAELKVTILADGLGASD